LGFDILLKDDLKPVLLEVNCNPSLRVDYELESKGKSTLLPSPIDIDIKKPLVLETLKLVAPRKKIQLM
jgi:tubulin polyglutamylase TTLL11